MIVTPMAPRTVTSFVDSQVEVAHSAEGCMQLDWDCQAQLFRVDVQNADDIRLNAGLFNRCLADKRRFCRDVPPDNDRAFACLEEHRTQSGFSADCRYVACLESWKFVHAERICRDHASVQTWMYRNSLHSA
jgi:hypothetical protein